MKTSRIVAGLLAAILTGSFAILPSLGKGFNEPMIVKVFYFFVIDAPAPSK